MGDRTFHEWLSEDASSTDHLREIGRSERTVSGIGRWPMGWLQGTGAVCYERAEGRVQRERRGRRPEAGFVRGLVKTAILPTAVANASDHYALVTSEGAARGRRGSMNMGMSMEPVSR